MSNNSLHFINSLIHSFIQQCWALYQALRLTVHKSERSQLVLGLMGDGEQTGDMLAHHETRWFQFVLSVLKKSL